MEAEIEMEGVVKDEEAEPVSTGGEADVVERYRALAASGADLVPQMVRGATLEEIDASVIEARRAYAAIKGRIEAQYAIAGEVPLGNPARSSAYPYAETLRPEAKIALGLRTRE
jgi:hypothetical protein